MEFMKNLRNFKIKTFNFNPYGVLLISANKNNLFYTARGFDFDEALQFNRMRYYNASLGRFMQKDLIFQGNYFSYVYNMPISYIDPFGLLPPGIGRFFWVELRLPSPGGSPWEDRCEWPSFESDCFLIVQIGKAVILVVHLCIEMIVNLQVKKNAIINVIILFQIRRAYMLIKKNIFFIILIIFISGKLNGGRYTGLIIDRDTGKTIAKSIVNSTKSWNEIVSLIYIFEDGKKYIEFKEISKPEWWLMAQEQHLKKSKWKDKGVENEYFINIKINEKELKFKLYGDTTYVYLKDEKGNILRDVDAFDYILKKDKEIMDFFEILLASKFKFVDCFQYVFEKKKGQKKLNIKKKKYRFKEEYIPCTETEKQLGFKCNLYIYENK